MATVSGGAGLDAALKKIGDKIGKAREVRVGFLEGATYPDGSSVASVAAINNFGAPAAGIPARPFFSSMIANKSPDWGERFARVLKLCDYDTDLALARMGSGIQGQLAQSIVDFSGAPNSPVTDLLKQRFPTHDGMTFEDVQQARRDVAAGETAPAGKPLVWSGDMLKSIDQEVA